MSVGGRAAALALPAVRRVSAPSLAQGFHFGLGLDFDLYRELRLDDQLRVEVEVEVEVDLHPDPDFQLDWFALAG